MPPADIPAVIAIAGFVGNAVWTGVNLTMQASIAAKIDELKDWMRTEYTSVPQFEACQSLCGERMGEICRRLDRLEGSRGPLPIRKHDGHPA